MPRIAVDLPEQTLRNVITEIETANTFINRSHLWAAVAKKLQETNPKITESVVALRVIQYNIEVKTPKGKKGRAVGSAPVQRTPRAVKLGTKKNKEAIAELYRTTPEKHHNLVKSIAKGSKTAAIKLHCLQCCGFERRSSDTEGNKVDMIGDCRLMHCAMWTIRPYQKANNEKHQQVSGDV